MHVTSKELYYCMCGHQFKDMEKADKCGYCIVCENPMPPPHWPGGSDHCVNCKDEVHEARLKKQLAEEAETMEKAELIEYKDNPAGKWIYSPQKPTFGNGFYSSIAEMAETHKIMPEFVFAARKVELQLNAQDMVEQACDEMHEDCYSDISRESEQELQRLLDNWCKEQNIESFTNDETKKIATKGQYGLKGHSPMNLTIETEYLPPQVQCLRCNKISGSLMGLIEYPCNG